MPASTEIVLQVIVGARKVWHRVAVEESWFIAHGDLLEMGYGGGKFSSLFPPFGHLGQQLRVIASHCVGVVLFLVGEDVGRTMDPGVGRADIRPQGGGSGETSINQGVQAR